MNLIIRQQHFALLGLKFFLLAYIFLLAAEAPLKFFISTSLLSFFKLALIASTMLYVIVSISRKWVLYVVISFLIVVIFSLFNYPELQVLYSLYLLFPFLAAALLGERVKLSDFFSIKFINFIFILTMIGLFIDNFGTLPWSNSSYTLGEQEVQIARNWQQNGEIRRAGFTSISWNASSLLFLCLYFYYKSNIRSIYFIGVSVFCFLGNFITTTKGVYIPMLYLFFMYFIDKFFGRRFELVNVSFFIFIFLVNLFSFYISWRVSLGFLVPEFGSDKVSILLYTLITRVYVAWSEVITYVSQCNLFLGCGLSSVGAASFRYDSIFQNAADNIFLYILSSFGFFGLIFILLPILKKLFNAEGRGRVLVLLNSVFLYGYFVNIFEFGVWMILLGFLWGGKSSYVE